MKLRTALLSLFCALAAPASAEIVNNPTGPALITVAGNVKNFNRGPSAEDDLTVLGALDISFDRAMRFDFAMLSDLPQASHPLTFPPETGTVSQFSGPTLASVLKAAGAEGKAVLVVGLDGYQIEIAPEDIADYDPVVAIYRDGTPLDIGGLGPAIVVFPTVADPDLQETLAALQVWATFLIKVR